MRKKIAVLAALLMLSGASGTVYHLNLEYSGGEVNLNGLDIVEGETDLYTEGDYTAKLLSFQGELLNETKFDFPSRISPAYYPNRELTGTTDLQQSSASVYLPYSETGSRIVIENETGAQKLSVNVSRYATCNQNNVCKAGENTENCPYDCSDTREQPGGEEEKGFFEKIIDSITGFIDWLIPV